jgi:chromosomal replication initiator protein
MHAIGNQILANDPTKKVLYVSSETFTTEFIEAITNKKNEEFRNKYRNIDVLLIDDIQFLAKAERTQEEFFYTFNALFESKRQIVISCDTPINKLEVLEDRLRTRFACGLIADVQAPDYETKVAILNQKASEKDLEVDNEILDYIASYTGENIRELEGVINHLSLALHQGREITINLAKEAMKHIAVNDLHEITAGVIIDDVSRFFDISVDDLMSKKRTKELVFPRQIAMYLCRTLTEMSYPDIGKAFNGKDHTTVMHACEQISKQVEINPELQRTMDELKRNIKSDESLHN